MSAGPGVHPPGGNRFPGFDVLAQSSHWDPLTSSVVFSRIGRPPDLRFFTTQEQGIATALFDQLLDQDGDARIAVLNLVDARLAEKQTDGWHYADMPADGQAWRDSLAQLDADARARFGGGFATCSPEHQATLIQAVQDLGLGQWHGRSAKHVWSLWTRYACTAFYSHPSVWNEIGFSGPAYPRGYKNPGVDKLEPYEVHDARPSDDPVREGV